MKRFLSTALALVMLVVTCITFVPVVSAAETAPTVITPDMFISTSDNTTRFQNKFLTKSWHSLAPFEIVTSDGVQAARISLATSTVNDSAVLEWYYDNQATSLDGLYPLLDLTDRTAYPWGTSAFVIKYKMNESAAEFASSASSGMMIKLKGASSSNLQFYESELPGKKVANEWRYAYLLLDTNNNNNKFGNYNPLQQNDFFNLNFFPYGQTQENVPTDAVIDIAYMGFFKNFESGIDYSGDLPANVDPVIGGTAPAVIDGRHFHRIGTSAAPGTFVKGSWFSYSNYVNNFSFDGVEYINITSNASNKAAGMLFQYYYDTDGTTYPVLDLPGNNLKYFAVKMRLNQAAVNHMNTYNVTGAYMGFNLASKTTSNAPEMNIPYNAPIVADEWVTYVFDISSNFPSWTDQFSDMKDTYYFKFNPFGNDWTNTAAKGVSVDIAYIGFFDSVSSAENYDIKSDTLIEGGAEPVITPELFNVGSLGYHTYGENNTSVYPVVNGLAKTWHGYTIANADDGVKLTQNTYSGRDYFSIQYDYFNWKNASQGYYPTVKTTDYPLFAIKYKLNAAALAHAQAQTEGNNMFILEVEDAKFCINAGERLHWGGTFEVNATEADTWAVAVFDMSKIKNYGETYGNMLTSVSSYQLKPFSGAELPAGAEMTIAWMGFFEDALAVQNMDLDGEVDSIDIYWDDFEYTCTANGTWNAQTHDYDYTYEWVCTSGNITLANTSAAAVEFKLVFTPAENQNVTASFYDKGAPVSDGVVSLSANAEKILTLGLESTVAPSAAKNTPFTVGTVSVVVTRAS